MAYGPILGTLCGMMWYYSTGVERSIVDSRKVQSKRMPGLLLIIVRVLRYKSMWRLL